MIRDFLRWAETASVDERISAASILANAYIQRQLSFDDRLAVEAALTLLLDDPSPKVRLALSETLSLSDRAPLQIMTSLAGDQPEVAAPVIVRSPVLTDGDLIDRVAVAEPAVQNLVASRPHVSTALAAAIAEVGCAEACTALLRNEGAQIAPASFRRIIERLGDDITLRHLLLQDPRLPGDCRYLMMARVGDVLSQAPFVQAAVGDTRAQNMARDACLKASVGLLHSMDDNECSALVEHLRLRGELTSSFLVRVAAHGETKFLSAALARLADQSEERVHGLLSRAKKAPVIALLSEAGLPDITHPPLLRALEIWCEVTAGRQIAGPQEVAWSMLEAVPGGLAEGETEPGTGKLSRLLKRIHLEALRDNAREQALALAAA